MKATSFRDVPLNIVGQSYESRSTAFSIQKTMNLIPQKELTGASEASLMSWPGCTEFSSAAGSNRGMTVFNGELYKVNDNSLFKIGLNGNYTDLGTITGSNRCIFANDGTNLIITTGGDGYQLTGTTLSQITDPDFQNGNSVTYLNQQMIFDGNGGQFQVADVGDPDSIQPNNFATAESAPDDTIRVYAWRDQLYIFGERTIETWYNTGTGNPPFSKVQNAVMQIGLGAVYSVDSTDEFVYFLGDDRKVYRFSATQPQNITSVAVSHQIDQLSTASDAIGYIVRIEGQSIYVLTFPSDNKTFAFNEDSGGWFNLSTGADQARYIGEDSVEVYGKRLISDKLSGGVQELSLDTYTDNGDVKSQERIFGPITTRSLGLGGSSALMSRIWFDMESGVGTITGQGVNPQMLVSVSFDDGRSWTTERDVLPGRQGQRTDRIKYDNTGNFRTMFVRLRMTDPVFVSIFGATLEVKAGGI